jgi:hypothetical protein
MANWSEFEAAEPEMAAIGRRRLKPAPIMMLATVRRSGAPRVHPVCPIFARSGMYIAVAGGGRAGPSPKRFDLQHDGRYAMHALPGDRDEEFYVTGRARRVSDETERGAVVEAAGHTVHDVDWVFELGIEHAMTAY